MKRTNSKYYKIKEVSPPGISKRALSFLTGALSSMHKA